jgi:two-component system, chemotaxis family, protein-glutamate methylesterase/glutaminase
MPGHNVIVIGASAGGLEALTPIVQGLPADFPAAIFVVVHIPTTATSTLPQILSRNSALPASHAKDGELIELGNIYVAPPNFHLIIRSGRIHLSSGPRENRHRPAIDALFRTAAHSYGARVIGVVLSGLLDDGTAGLISIKAHGGKAIVQDPEEAPYKNMPLSCIQHTEVDYISEVADIPSLLINLVAQQVKERETMPIEDEHEEQPTIDIVELASDGNPLPPSPFVCPDCGGPLWELTKEGFSQYRCHVGHVFSPESMIEGQAQSVEAALWSAVHLLKERAAFTNRIAEKRRAGGMNSIAQTYEQEAQEAEKNANIITQMLLSASVARNENAESPDRNFNAAYLH